MINLRKALPAAFLAFLAHSTALFASEPYLPPEGCTAFLTVQSQTCNVSILWQCDQDPAGHKWDAYFDTGGLQFLTNYSDQYAWMETRSYLDDSTEVTTDDPIDPISLTTLLSTGEDTYVFDLLRTENEGTRVLHVSGTDNLLDDKMTIDGHDFRLIHYDLTITEEDGTIFYRAAGEQLFSPEYKVFLTYRDGVIEDHGVNRYESLPIDIILPGEQGFADPNPLYGCNADAFDEDATPDTADPIKTGNGQNNDK